MRRTVLVFTAALLALAAGAAPLYADGTGMAQPQPAQPGAGPAVMTPPAACMMSAVAVDADAVYVLRGDQVMKLSKPNMETMACATLPQVPSEAMTVATSAPGAAGAGPATQQSECVVPSMAVADDAVYIVRGNEVLKLSKDLTQIRSTTVLPPVQPAQPAAAGRGPCEGMSEPAE